MAPQDAYPQDLLYAETHEWLRVTEEDGQRIGTVGISAFAVEQLTDLVFMELPAVGTAVEAGTEFGEVESVKAVSPLYSPVAGEIIAVNEELPDRLESLGDDPYGEGWLIKVKIASGFEPTKLLDPPSYEKQCAEAG